MQVRILTATEAATPPRRKPSAVDRGRGLVVIANQRDDLGDCKL
jgi:hypothetical protein